MCVTALYLCTLSYAWNPQRFATSLKTINPQEIKSQSSVPQLLMSAHGNKHDPTANRRSQSVPVLEGMLPFPWGHLQAEVQHCCQFFPLLLHSQSAAWQLPPTATCKALSFARPYQPVQSGEVTVSQHVATTDPSFSLDRSPTAVFLPCPHLHL